MMEDHTECEIKGHQFNKEKTYCRRCKSHFKWTAINFTMGRTSIEDVKKFSPSDYENGMG